MKELPDKKFDVIYADPPWSYEEDWGNGSNEHTYETMSIQQIKYMPVEEIAKDKSHLYLWVTNPFLKEGLEVVESWGFEYKTTITWLKKYSNGKPEMGMGYYFRGCTEHIIFATKEKKKTERNDVRNFFEAVNPATSNGKGLHSQKPEKARKIIEKMSSGDDRIELFARKNPDGWTAWGDEAQGNRQDKLSFSKQN